MSLQVSYQYVWTEDDVSRLQRLVPSVVAAPSRYMIYSPRPAPPVSESRPCSGPDTAASSPLYRPWPRLASAVGRGYNKTHVSLTVTLHVSTNKCHTTDRVHSLQILTLLASISLILVTDVSLNSFLDRPRVTESA